MAKNKQEFKVGDLVRTPRKAGNVWHDIPFGMVVEVVQPLNGFGNVDVRSTRGALQSIPRQHLKLAKQAMRKRDEYAARR